MLKRSANTVVYLAGKINGDPDYRKKFRSAEVKLAYMDYIVLNPAALPHGLDPKDYMRISLAMLESADAVVLLPDFETSEGATIEERYASYIGKTVSYYDLITNKEENKN